MRLIGLVFLSLNVLVLTGCAGSGPIYWTRTSPVTSVIQQCWDLTQSHSSGVCADDPSVPQLALQPRNRQELSAELSAVLIDSPHLLWLFR